MHHSDRSGEVKEARFVTTDWGRVLAAGGSSCEQRQQALEGLLGAYWYPLYTQVRRWGFQAEDAEDLTQGFLHQLLEQERLGRADPNRGRFRSFLLASLNHFLSNQRASRQAWKRGGRERFLAFGSEEAQGRWGAESTRVLTPERAFDVHWALALLELVLGRLRGELEAEGRGDTFDLLKPYLTGGVAQAPYGGVAARLGISEPAARMAVHRLRRRYRVLIREEIGRTLEDPALVEDEWRALLEALRESAAGW